MSAVATAIVGAGLAGAYISSQGAQSAASTQANAATQNQGNLLAVGKQGSQMDLNAITGANAPLQSYVDRGNSAGAQMMQLLQGGGNAQAVLNSMPGYQFARQQGLEATQNGFAAQGLGSSGAAMKGAGQYATGLANQNLSNYFNMLLQPYNTGATAAGQQAQNTGNLTTAASNALIGAGTNAATIGMGGAAAQAAGQVGSANAISNGLTGAVNGYVGYNMMNNLNPGMFGGSTTVGGTGVGGGTFNPINLYQSAP